MKRRKVTQNIRNYNRNIEPAKKQAKSNKSIIHAIRTKNNELNGQTIRNKRKGKGVVSQC